VRSALFWDIEHIILALPYRRFETTYRAHPQGSKISTRTNELKQTSGTNSDTLIFPINFTSLPFQNFTLPDHKAEQKFT
jgi:hypothetical protein